MKTKLLGCLAGTAMATAIFVATPALAFRGGMAGGGMHFGGGMPGGRMFTGRSVFVPGGNRFVGAPFAGRHAFVNRRFFDEGRRDRFEDRFRTGVFSSIGSITSRSLAYRSLTTTPRTGMVAGAGMAGSGLTSATIMAATITATEQPSTRGACRPHINEPPTR